MKEFVGTLFGVEIPIFPKNDPVGSEKLIGIFAEHQPAHFLYSAELYSSLPPLTSRLSELTCAIIGLVGDEDHANFDLSHINPRSQMVRIPGARRFPMVESADHFNGYLNEFLVSLDKDR